jgi:hypothetical protein
MKRNDDEGSEAFMIKTGILICALCGAGGTLLWAKSHSISKDRPAASATMAPWFQELHASSHLDNLPIIPVK